MKSIIAALLLFTACKGDTASQANESAKKVVDRTAELVDMQTAKIKNAAGEVLDLSKRANAVGEAHQDFAADREVHSDVLRVQLGILAQQVDVVRELATVIPVTETGRADIDEKLKVFQMRVDETGNAIQQLDSADATGYEARSDEAADAMKRLHDARDEAFKALDDAPRTDRSS